MKNENRQSIKKERAIMIISSAFVLTALTVTGVYIKSEKSNQKDDGYTIDFSTLGNSSGVDYNKYKDTNLEELTKEIEDDLDYMPMEVGGNSVILPEPETKVKKETVLSVPAPLEEEETIEEVPVQAQVLSFPGAGGVLQPVYQDVLIPYSMEKSVYFQTLDQYKYNPAIIYHAQPGMVVAVCSDCVVEDISYDPVTGYTVTTDLGDGYKAIYGQMDSISYCVGDVAYKGTALGTVANPTKYFALEGSNLYFAMEHDGVPINPEEYYLK